MKIHLARGVVELVRRLGEQAITVELTLDFEGDVFKSAVAFAGPSEPSLGYQRVTVGDLDVWWRQRLVFASREPKVTTKIRPRCLHVSTVGQALAASADYA